ncbi:MAG: SurA N-terminal domain-containing protein [Thermodesulfobacteriota bacterium]|nr:SurA N-terminal domain-containing protein [Thermodesulfobacteriota bacterium]
MLPRLSKFLWIIVFFLATASPVQAGELVNRIVAVVNGEIITLFELNERVKPLLDHFKGREIGEREKAAILKIKEDLLNSMVEDLLLRQEVEKIGIEVSDVEVETQIQEFKKGNNLNEEEFLKQLRLEKMTREDFAEKIRQDILKHRLLSFMVRRKVVVTKEEIEECFKADKQNFALDKKVHLGLIVLGSGNSAALIKKRIEDQELSFADAADIYSQGPGAGSGGDIGLLSWKDLDTEWKEALKDVCAGQITEPFVVRGREALLLLKSEVSGSEQPLNKVKDEIQKKIYKEKLEAGFNEYMDTLRANAVIDIKL